MKNKKMKVYKDGAEFLNDYWSDELQRGFDKETFEDWSFMKYSKVGYFREGRMIVKSYDVYTIDKNASGIYYMINNDKSMYEWYKRWCDIMEDVEEFVNEFIEEGDK